MPRAVAADVRRKPAGPRSLKRQAVAPAGAGVQAHTTYPPGDGGSPRQFLYPSSQDGTQREWRPQVNRDIARLVTQYRHQAMISDGRYIYTSNGQVRGAVKEKADYAIGSAWMPVYLGTDKNYRAAFAEQMGRWTENCDLRGRPFNFQRNVNIGCQALDHSGDFFIVLTKNEAGEPRLQFLEAHRFGSPRGETRLAEEVRLSNGQVIPKDSVFLNGIVYDAFLRPLAYNLLEPEDPLRKSGSTPPPRYNLLPASSVIHAFDPEWYSQSRGIPSLIYGILDWYDLGEIREAEKIATKATARFAINEFNDTGRAPVPNAHAMGGTPATSIDDIDTRHRVIANGLIRYFKASAGHRIEGFSPERPNRDLADFLDHIGRSAHRGLGWPIDMHDMSKIGGAAVRSVMGQIQRSVAQRQDALWTPCLAAVLYAAGKFLGSGALPFCRDWWNVGFTLPPKPSVDIGRDSQNRRADVAMRIRSVSNIAEEDGGNARDLFIENARDWKLAEEIAAAEGVPMKAVLNLDSQVGQPIEPEEPADPEEEAPARKPAA